MKTRTWALMTVLGLVAALAVVPAVADEKSAGLDGRIQLSLAGAAATDVFTSFGSIAGVEVDLDPALEGELTIELSNVTARTTLDDLCEMLVCKWWIEAVALHSVGHQLPMKHHPKKKSHQDKEHPHKH